MALRTTDLCVIRLSKRERISVEFADMLREYMKDGIQNRKTRLDGEISS